MLEWAEGEPGFLRFAWLFLFAYVFLLRVPSEALPVTIGQIDVTSAHAVLESSAQEVRLKLKRRKNKAASSLLV